MVVGYVQMIVVKGFEHFSAPALVGLSVQNTFLLFGVIALNRGEYNAVGKGIIFHQIK